MYKKLNKVTFFLLIFLLHIFYFNTSFASEPVHKEKLENGLTLLVKETQEEIVVTEVFVRGGVMCETPEQAGISLLTESLLLRGTKTRNSNDITLQIESVGGVIQGLTNPDYSEYFVQSTSDYFDTTIEVLADVIQHPAFSENEINDEKKKLYLEMENKENKPFMILSDAFNEKLYQRHPYGRPLLGYRDSIEKITRNDIVEYYNKNYVARNIVISIAGKIKTDYAIKKVKELFKDISDVPPPILNNPEEPKPLLWREEFRMSNIDSAWIFLGYPAPSISSKDFPTMEILQLIIGGGMNSRMWIKLREKKGMAYDLGSFMSPLMGPGNMVTYIATDPGKVYEVKKAILDEVRDIRNGKVLEEEIQTMKNFRIGQYYINQETVKNQAFNLGLYEVLGVGYEFYLKYPELIEKVKKENIVAVANEYLTNPVIVILSSRKPDIID